MAAAVSLLRERGARSVYVSCVHALFTDRAFDLLDSKETTEIVFTDTLPVDRSRFKNVQTTQLSLAPLIGDAIHRIHTGGSVGGLFL